MRSAVRLLAVALLAASVSGAAMAASGSDEELAREQAGDTIMADGAAVQEAETAVRQAEQDLQDYLGGTVTRGIMLNEERGKKLRELRQNVEDAKRRLEEARNQ